MLAEMDFLKYLFDLFSVHPYLNLFGTSIYLRCYFVLLAYET